MAVLNYPSSHELIVTFMHDIRRNNANIINGINPSLINMDGTQLYIYIKNLSPAQLSNDNPDIWRIQLPKRKEFENIKRSDKMFILFGYDYIRKVYTTWNPYWCKQRLNVAESCSMYSRLSLQERVSNNQNIEKMQLQNEGDVVCIPSSLLGKYLKDIKHYYPIESEYIPVGSSIQKRKQEEEKRIEERTKEVTPDSLFRRFIDCYNSISFKAFLARKYQPGTVSNYYNRMQFVFNKGYLQKYKEFFLQYNNLDDYKFAINTLCWEPEVQYYEELWHNAIQAALKQYLLFVKEQLYGVQHILDSSPKDEIEASSQSSTYVPQKAVARDSSNTTAILPEYNLDAFGKLKSLDSIIIEQLLPQVRNVEYPDWTDIIKQIKEYYPVKATEKMNPVDWSNLFEKTKWQKRRGRRTGNTTVTPKNHKTTQREVKFSLGNDGNSRVSEDPNFYMNSRAIITEEDGSIDIKKLGMIYDKKVTSYKYFWFLSIISLAKERLSLTISFRDIVARMAAMAWPIVMEQGIDLGRQDMIKSYLTEINMRVRFIKGIPSSVLESRLKQNYNLLSFDYILAPLLINVPYRFLSPWIAFTTKEDVAEKSKSDEYGCLYILDKESVTIKQEWWNYISNHYQELYEFSFRSFLDYVSNYNNDIVLSGLKKHGLSFFESYHGYHFFTDNNYISSAAEPGDLMDIEHVYLNEKDEVRRREMGGENAETEENDVEEDKSEIEEEMQSQVRKGTRVRLLPSQVEGVVVNHITTKSGEKRIVIQKDDGSILSAVDHPYLYEKVRKRRRRIGESSMTDDVRAADKHSDAETNNKSSIKEQFRSYLAWRKPDSTANGYTSTLDNPVRRWINKEVDERADSIFSYTTSEDVRLCIDLLNMSSDYVVDNIRQHNRMSAALSQYLLFIEDRESKSKK